jgi:diguanylate cyclase (GGDEF)-like protein
LRAIRGACRIKGDRREADIRVDPSAEAVITLTPTSKTRAHASHAPLRRLSEAALSARSDDELLAAFAAEARSALKVDRVEVLDPALQPVPPPPGPSQVVATARSLALDETRIVAELGAEPATRLEARSALLVPVAWAGDVRHVAVLARRVAHVWTPDEILIAETLANQAALGLARLESEQRRVAQAERDQALARAAHALNVSLELQAVLDTLAREADLAVGGEMAGVYLLDGDGDGDGTALATAGHNCPDEWFGYRLAPGEGIAGRVLATGRPVMTSAYDDDLTLPGHIVPDGVRSGVGVPMRWNGELRGALSVGFIDQRQITRDDLGVLEAIADLAVVACHNAEAYDHVRTAASTDALTGLLNHGAMQVRVREEIARAARDEQPLCCVLIDLDDFKQVNDELGHPAGDALLRRVADALRAEVRPYDQVARYGGDEFVLVLPGTEEQVARAIAERVRDRVGRGAPRGGSATGTCSIGVSSWEPPMTADDLLAAADRALLLAKRTGKGRVAVANPDAEEELARLQQADASPAAVQALAAAIEARDNYTHGHSEQVVRLATGVAMLLGLTADAVERVGHGALLHDVGKLAIPHEILHKGGALDDAEWRVMAEHPVIGEGILRRLPQLAQLAPIVRHEHEHWDGTGYPDGLYGAQIPIGSRIILACDAYAAMTTERPYRSALSQADAVTELRARAGTQFDPQVVDALLDLLGS